jgi:hypothetical protein
VKYTWTTTENGDELTDAVHVHVTPDGGESQTFVVVGLPPDEWARQRKIGEAVHMYLSEWEEKKFLADVIAQHDNLANLISKFDQQQTASPPMFAEFLIACLAPKNTAQALLGDLDELFQENATRFGERRARRKYWMQVASSVGPWLKRFAITVVVGYIRSKIGI